MADTESTTSTGEPTQEAKPTPPWGSDEDFNPEKAWTLIQNLRTENQSIKAASSELREKVDALTTDLATANEQREQALADTAKINAQMAADNIARTKERMLTAAGLDADTYAPMLTGEDEATWTSQVESLLALRGADQRPLHPNPAQSATVPAIDGRTEQARAIFGN